MTYTPATILPNLNFFQFSSPTNPAPQLDSGLSATGTTINLSSQPVDYLGNPITGNTLLGIRKASGYVEHIWCPAGSISGSVITGAVRGVRLNGLDITTGDSTLAVTHLAEESVFCAVDAVYAAILSAVIRGASVATGGLQFILGDGTNNTVTIQHKRNGSTLGWIRKNDGLNTVQFSDDGSIWINIKDTVASVLAKISVADTTPGYLNDKITVSSGTGITVTKTITNPGANEKLNLDFQSTVTDQVVDVPYLAAEDIESNMLLSKTLTGGTVEHTQNNTFSTQLGTESTFNPNGTSCLRTCNVAANKVAKFYRDTTNSLGYLVIGTVNARTGVTTWGTPVSLGFDVGSTAMKRMADNKLVLGYRKVSDNLAYAQVVTVSGTVPEFGAPKSSTFGQSASAQGSIAVECIDTDKITIAVRDTADSNKGHMACATVTDKTIGTFGSTVEWLQTGAGHAVSSISISKTNTDKCVVFCRDEGDSNKGYGTLVAASGTTLSANTEVLIDSNASSDFASTYDSSGYAIVVWKGGASGYIMSRIAQVSGLVLSYPGAAVAVNSAAASAPSITDIHSTTVQGVIAYEETGASDGKFNPYTTTATSVVPGTQYTINGSTNNVSEVNVVKVNGNNRVLIGYVDEADSNKGNAEVYQNWDNTSRAIGFSTTSVATGASINVRERGLVTVSGVSDGIPYYAGTTGLVSSTNTSSYFVGIGAATNSLDVRVNKDNAITGVTTATGANLTTLSNGSITTLHGHPFAIGNGTASGSGNFVVNNLTFTPRLIKVTFGWNDTVVGVMGSGSATATDTQQCRYVFASTSAPTAGGSTSVIITGADLGGNAWSGNLTTIASNGFTIALTKTNTPANITINWEAYA